MSSRVSLSGMDAAFSSLETPSTPMNFLGTLVQLGVSAPREWAEFTSTRLLRGAARSYSDWKLASRAGLNITVVGYVDSVDFGVISCERSASAARN